MGILSKVEIEKSKFKSRKWFFSITYADKIDGVTTWRKYPNYVSELFGTKKEAKADSIVTLKRHN